MNWLSLTELQKELMHEDAEFSAWVREQPDKHWAKLDISALRLGYELGRRTMRHKPIEVSTSQLIEGEIPTCERMKEIMGY